MSVKYAGPPEFQPIERTGMAAIAGATSTPAVGPDASAAAVSQTAALVASAVRLAEAASPVSVAAASEGDLRTQSRES